MMMMMMRIGCVMLNVCVLALSGDDETGLPIFAEGSEELPGRPSKPARNWWSPYLYDTPICGMSWDLTNLTLTAVYTALSNNYGMLDGHGPENHTPPGGCMCGLVDECVETHSLWAIHCTLRKRMIRLPW